jgi:hypothetical protein
VKRFVYFIYIFLSLFSFDFVHGATAIEQDTVVIPVLTGTFDGTTLTLDATTVSIPDGDNFTNVSYSIGSTSGNIIENNLVFISGTASFTYNDGYGIDFTIEDVFFTGLLSFVVKGGSVVEGGSVVFDTPNIANHILSVDFDSHFADYTDAGIIADFANKAYRGNITGITSLDITITGLRQPALVLHSLTGTFDGNTLTLDTIESIDLPDDPSALYNSSVGQTITDITYTNIVFSPTTGVSGVFAVPFSGLASFTYVQGGFSIEQVPFSGTLRFEQNVHGFLEFVSSENVFDIESSVFDNDAGTSYFADYTDAGIIEDFGNVVYKAYIDNVFISALTGDGTVLLTQQITPKLSGVFTGTDITGAALSDFTVNSSVYTQNRGSIRVINPETMATAPLSMTIDDVVVAGNNVTLDITGQLSFDYSINNVLEFTVRRVDLIGSVDLQIGSDGFLEFVSGSVNGFLATGSFALGNDDGHRNTNYQIVFDDIDLSSLNYLIQKNITVNFTSTYYGLSDRISVTSVTISEPAAINDWADAWSLENSAGGAQLAVTGLGSFNLSSGGLLGISGTAYLQYGETAPYGEENKFSFTLNELYVDFDVNDTGEVSVVAGQTLTNTDRGPNSNLNFSLVVLNDANFYGPTSTSLAPSRNINFVTTGFYDGVQTEITITNFDFSGSTSSGWTISDLKNKTFGSVTIEAPATGHPASQGSIAVSATVDAAPDSGGSLSDIPVSGNINFSVDDNGVAALIGSSFLTAAGLGNNEDISITLNAVTESVDSQTDSSIVEADITVDADNLTAIHNGVTSFVEFLLDDVSQFDNVTAGWTIDSISITGEGYLPLSRATNLDITGSVRLTHDDENDPNTTLADVELTGSINISVDEVGNITSVNSGSVEATGIGVTEDIDITFTLEEEPYFLGVSATDASVVQADVSVSFTSVYNGISSVITFDGMVVDQETLTDDWILVSATLTGTSDRLIAPAQNIYTDAQYGVYVEGEISLYHTSQYPDFTSVISVGGLIQVEITDDGAVEIIDGQLTGFLDRIDDDYENAGELNIILSVVQEASPVQPTESRTNVTGDISIEANITYNGLVVELEITEITIVPDVYSDSGLFPADDGWEITGMHFDTTYYIPVPSEGTGTISRSLDLVGTLTLTNTLDEVDISVTVNNILSKMNIEVTDDGVVSLTSAPGFISVTQIGDAQDINLILTITDLQLTGDNDDETPVVVSGQAATAQLNTVYNGIGTFVEITEVTVNNAFVNGYWDIVDVDIAGTDDAYFIVPNVGQDPVGSEINIPIAGTITLQTDIDGHEVLIEDVAVSGSVYVSVNDQGQVQVLGTSNFVASHVGGPQDIEVSITFPETEFADPITDLTAIPAIGTIQVASVNNGILIAVDGDTVTLDSTTGLLGQWDISDLSVTGLNAQDIPTSGYAYVDVDVTGTCAITNTYTNDSTFFGPATTSFAGVPVSGTLHFVINSDGDVAFAAGTTNTLTTVGVGDRGDIVLTITFEDLEVTESVTTAILANVTVDLFAQYTGIQTIMSVTGSSAVSGSITENWEIVDVDIQIDKPYEPFVQHITVPAQGEDPLLYDLLVSGTVTLKALNSNLDPDEPDVTLDPIAISGAITVSVDDDGFVTFVDGTVGVITQNFAQPIAIVLTVTDGDVLYQDVAHLEVDLQVTGRAVSNGNTVRIIVLDGDVTEKHMCVTNEYDACLEYTEQDVFIVERITYKNDGPYTVSISNALGTQSYPISMEVPVSGNMDIYHLPNHQRLDNILFNGTMYLLLEDDGTVVLDSSRATSFVLEGLGAAQDLYMNINIIDVDFESLENVCTQRSFLDTAFAAVHNYVSARSQNNLHTNLLNTSMGNITKVKNILGYDTLVTQLTDEFETIGTYEENIFTNPQYWIDIINNQFDTYDAYIQENQGHHVFDIWKLAEIIEEHEGIRYGLLHTPQEHARIVYMIYNILKKRLYTTMSLHGVNQ